MDLQLLAKIFKHFICNNVITVAVLIVKHDTVYMILTSCSLSWEKFGLSSGSCWVQSRIISKLWGGGGGVCLKFLTYCFRAIAPIT